MTYLRRVAERLAIALMRIGATVTGRGATVGKERAFTAMMTEHGRIISSVCLSFARSGEDYEDLRQDVLVNIWNGLDRFRGDSSVSTWIYRVALNTCVSSQRKARQRNEMSMHDLYNELYDNSPAEDVERYRLMYGLVRRLRPMDRSVMLMWLDGKSYEEIAGVAGLSREGVASRLKRSKDRLSEMYRNYEKQ